MMMRPCAAAIYSPACISKPAGAQHAAMSVRVKQHVINLVVIQLVWWQPDSTRFELFNL
jgi:hypothetical protein